MFIKDFDRLKHMETMLTKIQERTRKEFAIEYARMAQQEHLHDNYDNIIDEDMG